MFCTRCGNQLPDGARFCTRCGAQIAAIAPTVQQPEPTPVVPEPVVPEIPAVEEPVFEAPKPEEPVFEAPKFEEPVIEAPKFEEPAFEAPEVPQEEAPAFEAPVFETPEEEVPVFNDQIPEDISAGDIFEEVKEPTIEFPPVEEPEEAPAEAPAEEPSFFEAEPAVPEVTEPEPAPVEEPAYQAPQQPVYQQPVQPQYQQPQYGQYQAPQQPQYGQYQAPQQPQYGQYQAPQYQQPQYQAPQQPQYGQYQAPQYQQPKQPQYQAPQYQQPQYQAPQPAYPQQPKQPKQPKQTREEPQGGTAKSTMQILYGIALILAAIMLGLWFINSFPVGESSKISYYGVYQEIGLSVKAFKYMGYAAVAVMGLAVLCTLLPTLGLGTRSTGMSVIVLLCTLAAFAAGGYVIFLWIAELYNNGSGEAIKVILKDMPKKIPLALAFFPAVILELIFDFIILAKSGDVR